MVQQFKESTIVIIDTGRHITRAGRGLHDLLPAPTINVQSRVGIRKADASRFRPTDESMDVAAAATSSKPIPLKGARPSNYLVGHHLDAALEAGEELEVYWPFEGGDISDWTQVEAIWKYILFDALGLRRTLNEFPVLLSLPKKLSLGAYELLAQLFFERFNVAALCVNDRALLQLFAANQISGVVVDVGREVTDISAIVEAFVQPTATITIPIGVADCEKHLSRILKSNVSVTSVLSPPESPLSPQDLDAAILRFVQAVWKTENAIKPPTGEGVVVLAEVEDEGLSNVAAVLVAGKEKALIEAGTKKKAAAAKGAAEREKEQQRAAMDLVDFDFEDLKITLGRERHRFCEPLLDNMVVKNLISEGVKDPQVTMTLSAAINSTVKSLEDLTYRAIVWEAVYLTGELSSIKGFGSALQLQLQSYTSKDPVSLGLGPNGQPIYTDQAKTLKMIKVPEYFANFRDRGDELSAFLGASIVAKLTFNDPTGRFLAKATYSSQGPSAILEFI